MEPLVLALDLLGTFVFALSGAMAGVRHRLDMFGVLVLAFAAGNAGGITRDLLLGAVPAAAIADWRYIAVSLLAGLATFRWYPTIRRLHSPVLVFDAAGLGLFAVSGALKALAFGLNPLAAVLLGVLTGIGGGMLRDVLVAEIPIVLRAELYAVAALAGAGVVVGGQALQLPSTPLAIAGAALCFGLRLLAVRRGWELPVARPVERTTTMDTMHANEPPPQSERPPGFDQDIVDQFRANQGRILHGPFAGRTLLLLTTTGARTGRPLTKPLGFTRDGDRYVVIASNGGSSSHPAWYHNLVANPRVSIEVGDERFEACATVPDGAERERLYAQQAAQLPVFARYRQMTTRQIPVVVFERTRD